MVFEEPIIFLGVGPAVLNLSKSSPLPRNHISINFPNREELLLRTVLAFPNDSRRMLAERIFLGYVGSR